MKTIHFTWKDSHPPEELFPGWWRESWLESGWTSRLWTDRDIEEFTRTQPPEIQSLMKAYRCGVMRSDAFRYLLLKKFGGLYVDLDFVNLSAPSWITEIRQFACGDQGGGCLCNAFMWAPRAEDPFFDGIEEALLKSGSEWNPVNATGPRFLTAYAAGRPFHEIPAEWIYPVAWDDKDEILRSRGMEREEMKQRHPSARAVHIWSSSWFEQ